MDGLENGVRLSNVGRRYQAQPPHQTGAEVGNDVAVEIGYYGSTYARLPILVLRCARLMKISVIVPALNEERQPAGKPILSAPFSASKPVRL